MDLIPFYARFMATLSPCVDDVVSTLLDLLLRSLRQQIRTKDQLHIHTKLKNARLLGEEWKGVCGIGWSWRAELKDGGSRLRSGIIIVHCHNWKYS